jgi:periplasmic protein TonB
MGVVRVTGLNNNDRFNPHDWIAPLYPPEAVSRKIQDVVIIEFEVGADGKASETRIVRSNPLLDDAAVAAIRRWKFSTGPDHRVTAGQKQTVAMHFTL